MERIGNKLQYDFKTCSSCQGSSQIKDLRRCPMYGKAVNRQPNRVCPNCNAKNKHGHAYLDTGNMKDCHCDDGRLKEDRYSSVPKSIVDSLEIRVYRSDRPTTWNEQYLGLGCVFSTNDYGAYKSISDAELIDQVRASGSYIQATKLVDNEDKFCHHLGIFTSQQGYSVKAVWGEEHA